MEFEFEAHSIPHIHTHTQYAGVAQLVERQPSKL